MTPEELKSLVEDTVRRVLGQPSPAAASSASGKRLLFLVSGSGTGRDDALEIVRHLAASPRKIYVYATPCHRDRFGPEGVEKAAGCPRRLLADDEIRNPVAMLDRVSEMVLLMPRLATLVRIATGLAESPTEQLVLAAMMRGISVYTAGGDIDRNGWPLSMPEPMRRGRGSYGELVDDTLAKLERWGMSHRERARELMPLLLPPEAGTTAAQAPRPESRTFFTVEDIHQLREEGKTEMRLEPGAILTDAARELAATHGIRIVKTTR